MTTKAKITFEFEGEQAALAAELFVAWLSEVGEQDYWQWMKYRERPEEYPTGDITASFLYHDGCFDEGADPLNRVVKTSLHRMDAEE